jgi:hypothetical protein
MAQEAPVLDRLRPAVLPVPPRPFVTALLAVRNLCQRITDALTPPQAFVVETALTAMEAKLLAVSCELCVPDVLASGPLTGPEVAVAVDADPDAITRTLDFLASRGVYRRDRRGRFRNTLRSGLLRSDTDDSLRDCILFIGSAWHWQMWNEAPHVLRTGASGSKAATGSEFFDYIREREPSAGVLFDSAMESLSRLVAPMIATKVDLARYVSICDVGGGTGANLKVILDTVPHLTGVVFDRPEVVARAEGVMGNLPSHRWSSMGGDFFESVPGDHDLYLLKSIVHDWNNEEATRILQTVRSAMKGSARMLVVEAIVDPVARNDIEKAIDVLMLVATGSGRERTLDDFEHLFAAADLAIEERVVLATGTNAFLLRGT